MTTTKKGRGRPRNYDPARAEQAALSLFWQQGYEATGISQLGNVLGMSAPSIYAAFGSKAGLFERAVRRYESLCAPMFAPVFEAVDIPGFAESLLLAAAKTYSRPDGGRGCLVLDGTRNATDTVALEITKKAQDDTLDRLVEKLTELAAQHPKELAQACLTAMTGLSGAARNGMDQSTLLRIARILAKGIRDEFVGR